MPYNNTPVASGAVPYLPTGAAALATANDAIQIQLSFTNPPDSAGKFTVSGTYTGASVVFEKCYTSAEFTANTWTTLTGVTRLDTAVAVNGTLALTDNSTVDFQLPLIQGFFAIRNRLTAISTGSVTCEGGTFPGTATQTIPVVVPSVAGANISGSLPSSQTTLFGGGTGASGGSGNLSKQVFGTQQHPGATAADNVLAVYTLPASSFDAAGRILVITAQGSFATNSNSKTVKIIFNPASAVVGSTVGASGTTVATTGVSTGSNVGWLLQGTVTKYGAAASNTQVCQEQATVVGATNGGVGLPTNATATESGVILIAVTGNAATTATDIGLSLFLVDGMN